MRTDTVLRCEGMRILTEHLGIVEAERFVTLILREPFDYTEWRQGLFKGMSLEELAQKAQEYSESLPPPDCCKEWKDESPPTM